MSEKVTTTIIDYDKFLEENRAELAKRLAGAVVGFSAPWTLATLAAVEVHTFALLSQYTEYDMRGVRVPEGFNSWMEYAVAKIQQVVAAGVVSGGMAAVERAVESGEITAEGAKKALKVPASIRPTLQ